MQHIFIRTSGIHSPFPVVQFNMSQSAEKEKDHSFYCTDCHSTCHGTPAFRWTTIHGTSVYCSDCLLSLKKSPDGALNMFTCDKCHNMFPGDPHRTGRAWNGYHDYCSICVEDACLEAYLEEQREPPENDPF
jgi:hypothetical protein